MQLPPIPQPGKPLEATWGERVVDYLRSLTPGSSPTVQAIHLKGGCTYHAKPGKGGAPAEIKPFQLIVASSGGEAPTPMIRVVPSTLAGGSSTDLGFAAGDDPQYLLSPAEGVLVGGITFDSTGDGAITSRWLEIMDTFPDPDTVADGTDYVEIGTVHWVDDALDLVHGGHWSVTNSRYGPINAQICRNWFAAEAPFFGVSWS